MFCYGESTDRHETATIMERIIHVFAKLQVKNADGSFACNDIQ